MADNTTLNAGSGGDIIATDDIGGVKHQKVKVEFGGDGVATEVSAANPLPIVNAEISDVIGTTGNAGPSNALSLAGTDSGGVLRELLVDALGRLLVNIEDTEMNARPHVPHFGALKTSPTHPVVKASFPGSSLDTDLWTETVVGSGSTTVTRGVAAINTGTDSNGSVKLHSTRQGIFEAGQVTVYQSGVRAGGGAANNIRRWGLMDASEQNGLFFEWNGTTFRVVARAGGTDTAVASSSFNGEADWEPTTSNNTFRIHYSAGRALFQRSSSGKIVTLHTMVDSDYPLVEDLDLGLYYENTNTGGTTDIELRVRGASSSVFGELPTVRGNTVFTDDSVLQATKSILVAEDIEGVYRNVPSNSQGALFVADFFTAVALGDFPGFSIDTKFGRNPDTDPGTPEDLWNGGGDYTGFDATANENLQVFSASANDSGTLVDSGTATGGSTTTLVDSGANFAVDGVVAGDLLINDTLGAHGIITNVTANTLTVFAMEGNKNTVYTNSSGNTYRIANASGSGAAVIRISQILNSSFVEQTPKYAIMNGTSTVSVTVDAMRCARAEVVLGASRTVNAGTITVRQATTTANVFIQMPTVGQTTIGAFTVPSGKTCLIKRVRAAITRTNGSAGSATITLVVGKYGQPLVAKRVFEIQTGAPTEFTAVGGEVFTPGTDIKFRIEDVSDSNTVVDAAFEYVLIDV